MCVGSRYSAHHQQENIYPHIWPNEEHMVENDGTFFQQFTVRFRIVKSLCNLTICPTLKLTYSFRLP